MYNSKTMRKKNLAINLIYKMSSGSKVFEDVIDYKFHSIIKQKLRYLCLKR